MNSYDHQKLFDFIESKKAIVVPLPMYTGEQIGGTCKISAVYNLAAMYWLGAVNQMPPIPVRKCDDRHVNFSLRQYAKNNLNSQTGEVYDPNYLLELLKLNQILEGNWECIGDSVQYVEAIKRKLNEGQPVITFCDVDSYHNIYNVGGIREHAIVVVGYYKEYQRDYFVYLSWGQFFVGDALEIANSCHQLQKPREPEYFCKDADYDWVNCLPQDAQRQSINPTQVTLRDTIVYVNSVNLDERQTNDFISLKNLLMTVINNDAASRNHVALLRRIELCKNQSELKTVIHYFNEFLPLYYPSERQLLSDLAITIETGKMPPPPITPSGPTAPPPEPPHKKHHHHFFKCFHHCHKENTANTNTLRGGS